MEYFLIFVMIFMAISFLVGSVGMVLAPHSISDEKLEESKGDRMEIMDFPQLFSKSWYKPERYWVLYCNRWGWGSTVSLFLLVFIIGKLFYA